MHRILIFLVFLMVLTSSCAVKNVLWAQLGLESAVPTKPYPSKAIAAVCIENGYSLFDVAEIMPNSSVKTPLLLSVLLVVSFISPNQLDQRQSNVGHLDFFNNAKVPLYLRLGRLIYYS